MTRPDVRRAPTAVAAILAAVVIAGSCALPTDDSARSIQNDDVQEVMHPTSTTSTTAPVGQSRARTLFFIDDDTDVLQEVERQVGLDAGTTDVLNMLSQNPETAGLRTAVPQDLTIVGAQLDPASGTLTIELDQDFASLALTGNELFRAVAQIVVTANQLQVADGPIRSVRFVIGNTVVQVPGGPEGEGQSDPVDACDYQTFLDVPCEQLLPR